MTGPASDFLENGPAESPVSFLLAHGAGAPMDSPFMDGMAQRLGARGIRVLRFEFPYMLARRAGQRKPPPRANKLVAVFADVLAYARTHNAGTRFYIGGKSMGGRVAAMLAAEGADTDGVVCLGYPFHPPATREATRLEPLQGARAPVLICQGERDTFGNLEDVTGYGLPALVRVQWSADGDHDLKPRVKSGATWGGNLDLAADAAAEFMLGA